MKKHRFAEGGATEMEEGAGGYGALSDTSTEEPQTFKKAFASARAAGDKAFTWQGKKYSTDVAGGKAAPEAPGRPRGESLAMAPTVSRRPSMFAKDRAADRATVAAAVRNREAAAEVEREARGSEAPPASSKRKALSMEGVNPKTMLPTQGYAKGGSVRGGGCESRGKTKGRMV